MKPKSEPLPKTIEQMTPVQMIQLSEHLGQLQALAGACRQTIITTLANQSGPGPLKNYLSKFLILQRDILKMYALVFASMEGILPPPTPQITKKPK